MPLMKGSNNMKKYVAVFIVIALMLTVLISCNGTKKPAESTAGVTTTAVVTTTVSTLDIVEDTAGGEYSEIHPVE